MSKFQYDLEKIAKERNLKGIFVKELLDQIKEDKSNQDEILRVIEIGLNAMWNSWDKLQFVWRNIFLFYEGGQSRPPQQI